ncbi:hypothetical protein C8R45DRAFT_930755 [Mycena sanguinolenta]|nr:hypothetical protein C8R45DRAFT_930755 [Mycena sanguinolenta]
MSELPSVQTPMKKGRVCADGKTNAQLFPRFDQIPSELENKQFLEPCTPDAVGRSNLSAPPEPLFLEMDMDIDAGVNMGGMEDQGLFRQIQGRHNIAMPTKEELLTPKTGQADRRAIGTEGTKGTKQREKKRWKLSRSKRIKTDIKQKQVELRRMQVEANTLQTTDVQSRSNTNTTDAAQKQPGRARSKRSPRKQEATERQSH